MIRLVLVLCFGFLINSQPAVARGGRNRPLARIVQRVFQPVRQVPAQRTAPVASGSHGVAAPVVESPNVPAALPPAPPASAASKEAPVARPVAEPQKAPEKDNFTYANCTASDEAGNAELKLSGNPKVSILEDTTDDTGEGRRYKFSLKDLPMGSTGMMEAVHEVDFGKPAFVDVKNEMVIWKAKATFATGPLKGKRDITYIEMGDPLRKIFAIQGQVMPRGNFYGNQDGKGDGTYHGLTVFDNQGNFVALGSEVDSSTPPQRVFKAHATCGKPKSDLLGFAAGDALFNVSDPVLGRGVSENEIPKRFLGPADLPTWRSRLNESAARDQLADAILGDPDLLSPARERFAQALKSGDYQKDPLFLARQAILGDLPFVKAPKLPPQLQGANVQVMELDGLPPMTKFDAAPGPGLPLPPGMTVREADGKTPSALDSLPPASAAFKVQGLPPGMTVIEGLPPASVPFKTQGPPPVTNTRIIQD
ncbi:hypothetical protein K2X33_05885 [bacterium]|nr:hypothetical protein [bacterium]